MNLARSLLVSTVLLAASGCGSEAGTRSEPAPIEATRTTGTVDSVEPGEIGPVAVSSVRYEVEFSPACGAERLLLDEEIEFLYEC